MSHYKGFRQSHRLLWGWSGSADLFPIGKRKPSLYIPAWGSLWAAPGRGGHLEKGSPFRGTRESPQGTQLRAISLQHFQLLRENQRGKSKAVHIHMQQTKGHFSPLGGLWVAYHNLHNISPGPLCQRLSRNTNVGPLILNLTRLALFFQLSHRLLYLRVHSQDHGFQLGFTDDKPGSWVWREAGADSRGKEGLPRHEFCPSGLYSSNKVLPDPSTSHSLTAAASAHTPTTRARTNAPTLQPTLPKVSPCTQIPTPGKKKRSAF